jgi:hypothetical protein
MPHVLKTFFMAFLMVRQFRNFVLPLVLLAALRYLEG